MNDDQVQTSNLTLDAPPEAIAELDPLIDRGDATPEEPKTEPELRIESQNKIEANFQITEDIRKKAIEQRSVSQEDADNFRLIAEAPKAADIYSEFKKVTQELKDGQDSEAETKKLRQMQAELLLAYAYNTVALLHKYYKEKMLQDILDISKLMRAPGHRSKQEIQSTFEEKIGGMGKIAADLETFHQGIAHLVPEVVKEFSDLQLSCDEKNKQFLTFLGRNNQLKTQSDQSAHELERFVTDLQHTISLTRIQNTRDAFNTALSENLPSDAALSESPTVAEVNNWSRDTTSGYNLGGWITDVTPENQGQVVTDKMNDAGEWQSPDTTQPGQQITYEAQVDDQKPSDDAAVEDDLDELIAVSQAQNKQQD